MAPPPRDFTIEGVNRFRSLPAIAAALLAVLFAHASARAQTANSMTIGVQSSPVIRMQLRSGTLTVRTWNKSEVKIDASAPVQAQHFDAPAVARAMRTGDIPIFAAQILTPNGALLLPPEDFPVPALAVTPHDGIRIEGGGADVTLTVPQSTALIWAVVGRGRIALQDYRSGTFVLRVHSGGITLANTGGDAYVEAARGLIRVAGSAFNRIRARTAAGNIFFENCNARQIEVSSIDGSIAYDDGTFVPGLARFESVNGSIALGLAGGGAEIAAHSSGGRVYSGFDRSAQVNGIGGDVLATLGGGGPVVTASSQAGNIYLYTGSFRSRPRLLQRWRPLQRIIKAKTSAKRPYRA